MRLSEARLSIDRQMPDLTYLGLAFWMLWNTIGFSGSFWMHESVSPIVSEHLSLAHLLACIVTLCVIAGMPQRFRNIVAKNWCTAIGALIACAGTGCIVATPYASEPPLLPLFLLGCACTGFGTTLLFMRAAPLYGALPPRRALISLIECLLISSMVFLALVCCDNSVATAFWIATPLVSALLLCIRTEPVRGEGEVLHNDVLPTREFALFLMVVIICSAGFKVMQGAILVNIPPDFTTSSAIVTNLLSIIPAVVIVFAALIATDERANLIRGYLIAIVCFAAMLFAMAISSAREPLMASVAGLICNFYNIVTWAILAWMVFQSQAGALRVFGFGNAALALGTAFGNIFSMALNADAVSGNNLPVILVILCGMTIAGSFFIFSESRLSQLLRPIDERRLKTDTFNPQERMAAEWEANCERLSEVHALTPREREVFMRLARGATPAEIAEQDTVSIYTVRAHIRSVYSKLDVHSRQELITLVNAGFEDS